MLVSLANIVPKPEYAFDPRDETKLERFRNDIWYDYHHHFGSVPSIQVHYPSFRPSVERMNALAPQHSRLFKEVGAPYPFLPINDHLNSGH